MSRTYNTKVREPWNPKIKTILDAIDLHIKLHLETGEVFHINQAEILRNYVYNLKSWIESQELTKVNLLEHL